MKAKTRFAALLLALSASVSLAACGGQPSGDANAGSTPQDASSGASATDNASSGAAAANSAPTDSAAPADSAPLTLKVGASPAPHAEILGVIKPMLEQEGINLEIVEFTDYVMPNKALDAGDLDANYFQHYPYLADFNTKNETTLISAAAVHFEPLGLYPGKTASLDALADGAAIAVPNDATNEARALLLLQAQGLIKLKDGAGLEATPLDIAENTKNLQFVEIEAAQLPGKLPDVDLAVINGNYAVEAGIIDTMLTSEDPTSEAASEFANILAVRNGDDARPEIQKLVAALQSEEVRAYINETYKGAVIPVF